MSVCLSTSPTVCLCVVSSLIGDGRVLFTDPTSESLSAVRPVVSVQPTHTCHSLSPADITQQQR